MENETIKFNFPDYDPDIMETSDAKSILSHFEETYPIHYHWMKKNDLLYSFLYSFVNEYIDKKIEYKKQGYLLQIANELSFNDTTASIKLEFENKEILKQDQKNVLPDNFFDLDSNSFIDTDTF